MRTLAIAALLIAAVGLGIAGILFLEESTSPFSTEVQGTRSMISGIVCLSLGVLLLIAGTILAFIAGAARSGRADETSSHRIS
jgi:hypothetical protein